MTEEEIYQQMAACFEEETGTALRGDGDMAVRLYAVAAQIYGLYVQAEWVDRQCFPQTAAGEFLDKHAQLRGLARRQATAAQGTIRFSTDSAAATDLVVPAGTICLTAGGVRFETTQEAVLEAGETAVDVPARAVEPGAAGNAAAGTIRAMAVAPVGVSGCTNPAGFSGGTDEEEDEALRARVLEMNRAAARYFYSQLNSPAGNVGLSNAAFYQQGALSFDEGAAAAVIPRPRGVGSVDVVVSTAAGAPSAELLEELEDYFEARREIAVDVQVKAPEVEPITVNARVQPEEGRDCESVCQAAEQAVQSWFDGRLLGQDVLRAKLGDIIFSVDGVKNYVLDAPAADVTVDSGTLPRLTSVTVTELGADA